MRCLVTGSSGFIGSHLCKRLVEENNQVICLDNFFTGRKENILELLNNKNFEVIRLDVIEAILLEVDQIYNLACPASPVHYQYDPIKTIKTNMLGTMNLLELAKKTRARFLQASTSFDDESIIISRSQLLNFSKLLRFNSILSFLDLLIINPSL